MHRLLVRFLGRLSVGRKLLLIFLLDMTAVAFISGILVNEKFLAIDFARKELAGNAYIGGLRDVLLHSAAVPVDSARPTAVDLQGVADTQARWGHGLDSMGAHAEFTAALRAWQDSSGALQIQAVQDKGRALITRVGNQSNLILDPDLDSYYTMSIVVLRMPELLDAVVSISRHVTNLKDPPARDAHARFLLLEGRLDAGGQGLESDLAEAMAASTPALAQALGPSHQVLAKALKTFRDAARTAIDNGGGVRERAVLRTAHLQLLQALSTAWADTARALDTLIQERIDRFFARMWLHLGTALGLLTLILSAVFFVARQIALPLKHLSVVTEKVRQTGDHSLRASWHSSDEIGRLVAGFNDMLAQLDHVRQAQEDLVARTHAAQAQQQLVEAIPIPMMVTAIPGHQVLHANQPARAWLGDLADDPWRQGLEPAVRARFFQQLADREAVNEFEVHWRTAHDASWVVLSARQLMFQGQDAVLTTFAPINHLKLLERRLELWAKVFEASGEGILIVDANRQVLTVNRAFCRSTGYEAREMIGTALACVSQTGSSDFANELWDVLANRSSWQGEVTMHRRDGGQYPAWMMVNVVREGHQSSVSHYIVTTLDISDRKRSEERIRFLAQHDVLTELPNRALCLARLAQAMQQAREQGHKVAVMFIDLDRFKTINDSLGHHVGDGLLRSVARRLVESVRAGDTVSRLGGDEFVVLLNGVAHADEVVNLVEHRLVPQVRRPHEVDGTELHVSCSVGIAIYPDDASDIDTLMRHADAAMYQAKASGRDAAHFFTPELNERAQRRSKVESSLRYAVSRQELALHYQPRVDARSGQLMGVEALLRWHSPELGDVPPAQFIPVAEEAGLIVEIGDWVIDEACRQMAAWRAVGMPLPQVSVNVSALQVRDDGLVQTVRKALDRHALPPDVLELELTESMLMDRADQTLARLHAIKRLGVALAIDDFGTGYSSLAYLNRFPIDRLKIDRSFVRDMLEDPTDLAITRAIIGLGHTLGLKVVAEGVESEREAQTLRAMDCDELQGYLYAKPMAAQALASWIRQPRMRLA